MTAIAKTTDGLDIGFLGELADGSLATGIAAGDITITCVAPDKTATSVPTAAEAPGLSGLYTALVPSAFLVTNGPGVYFVAIVVASASPLLRSTKLVPVVVTQRDIDDVFTLSSAILGVTA